MPKRKPKPRPIPSANSIRMFMHCKRCLQSIPPGESAQSWSRLSMGWTDIGFQVWCHRHEVNIVHVDFEGQVHPAEQGGSPERR